MTNRFTCMGWMMLFAGIFVSSVEAQSNIRMNSSDRLSPMITAASNLDTLWIKIFESPPNTGGWDFDNAGLLAERFDATGDGVSDLVTVEKDAGGTITLMRVMDTLTSEVFMTVDIASLRDSLVANGFSQGEAQALKFRGFFRWTAGNAEYPNGVTAFFIARGAPVIYDPTNKNVIFSTPDEHKVLALADLDGDKWPDLVLGDKMQRVVQVYASKFSPAQTGN